MLLCKLIRINAEQTAKDVAARSGIGAPDFSRIERGIMVPTPVQKLRIAAALGYSANLDSLFEDVI